MRSRFRPASLIIAILAALILVAPVAAANQWTTFKQSGTHAFAYNQGCVDNADGTVTCDGQAIDVFEGLTRETGQPASSGQHACYSEHHVTYNPQTGETLDSVSLFGCTLDAGTLTTSQLDSITLAPTTIELIEYVCDATECTESDAGSITVQGTWTGVGPTTSQRGKFRFDDGSCLQLNSDKTTSRAASFDGSIDAVEARIGQGSFTFKTTCSF